MFDAVHPATGSIFHAALHIASVYGKKLQLRNQLVLMISQSGMSDDLILFAEAAKASGALIVAITNGTDSPLASRCDIVLALGAGLEQSVAATKTFVASVSALLQLTAAWTEDRVLHSALRRLPQRLAEATSLDWSEGVEPLTRTRSLVTLGRGPTFAMAREAALKLKETCNLHAEAFSGTEFLHGPIALASNHLPIVMFMPNDEAAAGMRHLATDLARRETTLGEVAQTETCGHAGRAARGSFAVGCQGVKVVRPHLLICLHPNLEQFPRLMQLADQDTHEDKDLSRFDNVDDP